MYSFKDRVRFSEVDCSRRLDIAGVADYFQDCSLFHSEHIGLGFDYLDSHNRAWFLSAWQIEVKRYPKFDEEITVRTWPYSFKSIYGYRNFDIVDADGEEIVRANSIWFYYDTKENKPVKPQPDDVKAYEVGEPIDMEYAPRKIVVEGDSVTLEPLTVKKEHLDSNNHVNNVVYIRMALDYVPEGYTITGVRVEYRNATTLGTVLIPKLVKGDNKIYIELIDDKDEIHAIVEFMV